MFGKKKSGDGQEGILSLNLQPRAAAPSQPVPQPPAQPSSPPNQTHPAQQEIDRRTKHLLEHGKSPEIFFFPVNPANGSVTVFTSPQTGQKSMLFFTSPLRGVDYLRSTKTAGAIAGIRMEALPASAEAWRNAGVDSFILNKCPRCAVFNVLNPKDKLINSEQMRFAWAVMKAIRDWKGEQLLRQYQALQSDLPRQRAMLENLRDHVEYDNPYLHWMIAMIAGVQKDEPARLAATADLEEFGPDFKDKTAPIADAEQMPEWGHRMSQATLGLFASFGMIDMAKMQKPQP